MSTVLLQKKIRSWSWESNNLPFHLSPEEEIKLFQELEKNPENKEIEGEIINRNTRLVKKWVKEIRNSHPTNGLTFRDLCQEGAIGLMEAVGKFDLTKKYKFSTYASYWIRRAIIMGIDNESREIRIPTYKARIIERYEKVKIKLFKELKCFPSVQEIAEKMGIKLTEVEFMEKIKDDPISLESPFLRDDNERTLMDTIINEKSESPLLKAEEADLKERIKESFSCLTSRESRILAMRFGLENGIRRTLKEAGDVFSITKERTRQIQEEAMAKLRKDHRVKKLRKLLE